MIYVLDINQLSLEKLQPLLGKKNTLSIHKDNLDKTTDIIKQWIAIIIHEKYMSKTDDQSEAAKLMAKEQKYFFRFVLNSLVEKDKFILVTK